MTKPDWAERLQRTRKREYDKGVEDERSRIIKLLEAQPNGIWQKFMLEQVIALINGEQE